MPVECGLCPRRCKLEENQLGFCRARRCSGGQVRCDSYGRLTAVALDPIEKKPLKAFYPGAKILSVGSYGCNLRCPFCQNAEISMSDSGAVPWTVWEPETLVEAAAGLRPKGNIGIAYTYNEPLTAYEFVRDCAVLARERGLKNVLVTNGCFNERPVREILPLIDALNIDLKGFTERFYQMVQGDLETVKRTICFAAERSHVEVTTLVIPGENDSAEEMERLSGWLASVDPKIPLHITRFFPRWEMSGKQPTPLGTIRKLAEVAGKRLETVYAGNC